LLPPGQRLERRGGDLAGNRDGGLRHVPAGLAQRNRAATLVAGILLGCDEAARDEAIDHALDGCAIQINQASKLVLRARAHLQQLRQRRELRLRQSFDHARHEDRGVALHRYAHQEPGLIIEAVAPGLLVALRDGPWPGVLRHDFEALISKPWLKE
jgi:hypothetical protein